ncbi:DUF1778 domain-containing protein [Cohaesibacter sp. CAU 1516]|uniref:type II toxin-antitoxin system TacA family antitoxin n=1 Tax=Cohaesibacter sp. CAU 1516 TaxID=2576038 RepID=UPI0010FD21E5|nr:DUF1778 domain-containing protein [Cohaesibacter sp. CAU 1516]TLP42306.1 DUF1778 domain-containing protein [Cohaesibacter sp. CAU 1516]
MKAYGRINLRLTADEKKVVEKAAAIVGKNVNRYIVDEISRKSRDIIAKHETMRLGRKDSERFMAHLLSAPPFNDKLEKALRLHDKTVTVK